MYVLQSSSQGKLLQNNLMDNLNLLKIVRITSFETKLRVCAVSYATRHACIFKLKNQVLLSVVLPDGKATLT